MNGSSPIIDGPAELLLAAWDWQASLFALLLLVALFALATMMGAVRNKCPKCGCVGTYSKTGATRSEPVGPVILGKPLYEKEYGEFRCVNCGHSDWIRQGQHGFPVLGDY